MNNAKQVINPQKNSREIDRHILSAEKVFLLVAILITSIGFYVWGSSTAAQYTDIWAVQALVGVAAALASAYVTDFAFRHFLEEVVFQALAVWHPNRQASNEAGYFKALNLTRWVVLTTVVVLLFVADWFSVQTVKDPFAAQAKQREIVDVATVTASVASQYDGVSAPLASQITSLKKDIAAEERRIEAANGNLKKLIASGNGWAANELAKKKARATKAARAELSRTQSAYSTALEGRVSAVNNTAETIQRQNTETAEDNATKRAALSAMFFMFGAGSKALTVLLRIFLVVSFLAKSPTLDANGDGIVDGRDVTEAAARPDFR